MCVTEGIMLCGASPTCMFPHSEIRPVSPAYLPHMDPGCGHMENDR